ncbi:ribulose-phosphate 3-epimerase [Thalassobacillus sp. CUG 92003]|uniref:ribulose-phosphate 3-epimerase n=1 Tax=Thalassobacillus sp. CUG 92003 TaxID=2736641 RepID=UPI0015E6DD3D|nr:ribulose-phosphate 3-epimerase [Thalassobacillus sp. CUG 92003]
MTKLGPSLMCADMGLLRSTVEEFDQAGIDYFHFDIMDGNFVPNFSMGIDMVKDLRPHTDKPFDIHLMVAQPDSFIPFFADAGADMITIHAEISGHVQRVLQSIKQQGLKAGIALNPSTPLQALDYIIEDLDYITVMTVNPGFAGQSFIPSMYRKISDLNKLIQASNLDIAIQVDGNIGFETAPQAVAEGADMLVCGTSSLFKQNVSYAEAVMTFRSFLHNQNVINKA